MLEYFNNIKVIFSSSNFSTYHDQQYFTLFMFIIYSSGVCINILKLIYEMNLKFQIAVHILSMLHETINLAVIIFLAF
jgi:predicted transcriptional regulator